MYGGNNDKNIAGRKYYNKNNIIYEYMEPANRGQPVQELSRKIINNCLDITVICHYNIMITLL